jgi:hypothetical protein
MALRSQDIDITPPPKRSAKAVVLAVDHFRSTGMTLHRSLAIPQRERHADDLLSTKVWRNIHGGSSQPLSKFMIHCVYQCVPRARSTTCVSSAKMPGRDVKRGAAKAIWAAYLQELESWRIWLLTLLACEKIIRL